MRTNVLTAALLLLTACSGSASSSSSSGSESPAPETTSPAPAASTTNDEGDPGSAAPSGALCGTRGAAACPAGTFCDFAAGSQCGATDAGGHCAPIPEVCTREYMPVCGCDGQTHPTACVAHSNGVSVDHDGPC